MYASSNPTPQTQSGFFQVGKLWFTAVMAALACLANSAQAAISVPGGGTGNLTLDTAPAATEWATYVLATGGGGTYTTVDGLTAGVQTLDQATITTTLPTSATVPPSTSALGYRYNTAQLYIQSRPTTGTANAAQVLKATLQNDTAATVTTLSISYDFGVTSAQGGVDELPGWYAYYSVSGAPGTWVAIPALSAVATAGRLTATIDLGATPWAAGTPMYILWADDNDDGDTDTGFTMDNIEIIGTGGNVPPSIRFASPVNNQTNVQSSIIAVNAVTTGLITNVDFLLDSTTAVYLQDSVAPFRFDLNTTGLALGSHTLRARGTNWDGVVVQTNVTFYIVANTGPFIAIATNQPTNNILVGTAFTNLVQATDDVGVVKVDWYVNNNLIYTRSNSPWTFVYNDTLPGTNIIVRGVAFDAAGLTASATNRLTVNNPAANFILIVTNGSDWKYYATTNEPEAQGSFQWYVPGYSWAAWSNAPRAEIGGGDNSALPGDSFYPERTVIDFGSPTNPPGRYRAVYFVKEFSWFDSPGNYDAFSLVTRLLRDDGAAVYLNGVAIWTNNLVLTNGYQALATTAADDGTVYQELTLTYDALLGLGADLFFGNNVVAVEVHQSGVGSSDLSFDLMLWGQTYSPPTVTITSPTNTQVIAQGDPVQVNVASSPFVSQVDFYLDGTFVDSDFDRDITQPNFFLPVTINSAGVHAIRAIGIDTLGNFATSSVNVTVVFAGEDILAAGSTWKYLYTEDATAPGAEWVTTTFTDDAWLSGAAPLGYGDTFIVTDVRTPLTNIYASIYYRNTFTVANPSTISNLTVQLRRDDGGVVYINGVEVFRSNMPGGAVTHATLASGNTSSESEFFPGCVSPSVLVAGVNHIAVSVHQNNLTSSDTTMDLRLIANAPIVPPTVAITAPTNGATFIGGDVVNIAASAVDTNCGVAAVEFYDGATLISSDATAAYTAAWIAVAGTHTLTAKVISTTGGSSTTNVTVNVIPGPDYLTIVDSNSVWKYLDDGSNQGTAWAAPTFNDSAWASGPATLGYGDAFVVTTNSYGPEATNKYITTYYRHTFNYDGAGGVTGMVVRLLVDDGAVVHLNGNELYRNNMPAGPVDYLTEALGTQTEGVYFTTNIPVSSILVGQNVFAVEVHQEGVASSDLSFNLQLQAVGADIVAAPKLNYVYNSVTQTLTLSWTEAGYELVQANTLAGPWTRVSLTSPQTVSTATGTKFYQLHKL